MVSPSDELLLMLSLLFRFVPVPLPAVTTAAATTASAAAVATSTTCDLTDAASQARARTSAAPPPAVAPMPLDCFVEAERSLFELVTCRRFFHPAPASCWCEDKLLLSTSMLSSASCEFRRMKAKLCRRLQPIEEFFQVKERPVEYSVGVVDRDFDPNGRRKEGDNVTPGFPAFTAHPSNVHMCPKRCRLVVKSSLSAPVSFPKRHRYTNTTRMGADILQKYVVN